jgi:pilus assembly protein CpaC
VRRAATEIELESGQSFAIAGLLDNRVTDTLSKVPGLGDIPFFGRLFQSRSLSRSKSELLVVVTPELVDPPPAGAPPAQIAMPKPFLKDGGTVTAGGNTPDPNPPPAQTFMPAEQMLEQKLAAPTMSAPQPPLGMTKAR